LISKKKQSRLTICFVKSLIGKEVSLNSRNFCGKNIKQYVFKVLTWHNLRLITPRHICSTCLMSNQIY